MDKWNMPILAVIVVAMAILFSGCVERRLKINTKPQEALVVLNDEEIGQSPVTVPFNWYGDYNVRISKEGYETLKTHRMLKSPWYDKFPWDFFAQIVSPKKIRDSYEWTFELSPKQPPDLEQLVQRAQDLKEKLE